MSLKQCKEGHPHTPDNTTKAGNCRMCLKARNDSRKEYNAAYRKANAEAVNQTIKLWQSRNKDRIKENARAYRNKNREKVREDGRVKARKRYGILNPTAEMRSGPCPICPFDGPLVMDHDHKTGKVRGWICSSCNRAIGQLGDDLESLLRAVAYMQGSKVE